MRWMGKASGGVLRRYPGRASEKAAIDADADEHLRVGDDATRRNASDEVQEAIVRFFRQRGKCPRLDAHNFANAKGAAHQNDAQNAALALQSFEGIHEVGDALARFAIEREA